MTAIDPKATFDKMKKRYWRDVAEIIGVVSIATGLVLVAWEIRTNTLAVESASSQAVTDASLDVLLQLASNPELARLRRKGDFDIESLTDDEAWRYFVYYRGHWLRYQNVFLQSQMGVLGQRVWYTYSRTICSELRVPGIRAGWQDHSAVLDSEFVATVESCPTFKKWSRQ